MRSPEARRCSCCTIIPPNVLRRLLRDETDPERREALIRSIETSSFLRGRRVERNSIGVQAFAPAKSRRRIAPTTKQRTICDAGNRRTLPGRKVRDEGGTPTGDTAADQAYDNAGITYDFFATVFQRDSIDGRGMELLSTVHYDRSYNNAFWDSSQMVYGDGDGKLFLGFANILDVVAHELSHGVTQYTVPGGLVYQGFSGALNESISDVFGSVVKQWSRKETVDQADWLIGLGMMGPGMGRALRSLAKPGTAWKFDDQSDHMSKVDPTADVHTNSGVPNRAFYLTAIGLGGRSWDKAAPIWYAALPRLSSTADFREMRALTTEEAEKQFGKDTATIVANAWQTVGVYS